MEIEVKQEDTDSLPMPVQFKIGQGEQGEPIVLDEIGELELFPDVQYCDQKG